MKTCLRLLFVLGFAGSFSGIHSFGQVAINTDGSAPHPSAILDVKSTGKGMLPPRMTQAELYNIAAPETGLLVFCTDCGMDGRGALAVFMGGSWNLSLLCPNPNPPSAGVHVPGPHQITWHWDTVPEASGYKWSTLNDYLSATDLGNVFLNTETGLVPDSLYSRFLWAYNSCGKSVPANLTCQTSSQVLAIGQSYGGGIIFYLDGTGEHGLIAAPADQVTAQWGCHGSYIGATLTAVGTGQTNTNTIVLGCSTPEIAAKICNELVLNGYDDWYLPSRDELWYMYSQKTVIGGFLNDYYWSSSEFGNWYSWLQNFSNGVQDWSFKNGVLNVRAIRSF
ncbi:MAG TPA: DUF1566 domain-containing protein [Bacteroidales bacterium]|nr:DUF1566 domain-containing protein [Bacteroidales bacterium]HPS63728.1 DUF1566 domain-containing protein [Bacteroidales bacterium]